MMDTTYNIRHIEPGDNAAMAALVRHSLKQHQLDIPGTAYFDESLDDLHGFYTAKGKRGYFVLVDGENQVLGGIGFAECDLFSNCAELQKLYLADRVKGQGLGYRLIAFVEEQMRQAGYQASYLETHHNLKVAMHTYESTGYREIPKPAAVIHSTMDHFYYKAIL